MVKDQASPWFQYPSYHWSKKTVAVIGAGIAGSQIAWHLARRDWQVTVIERHSKPAQEASGNLAGIISPKVTAKPSLGEDFYWQCYQYTLNQLDTLKNQSAESPNWNPVGVLQLVLKERDQARWKQLKKRTYAEDTLQCLEAKAASQVANIPIDYPAVYFPKAGWIEPVSFCKSLLSHKNITLIKHTEAMDIQHNHGNPHWEVIDSSNHTLSATEALIICSGKNLNFSPIQDLPSVAIAGQTSLALSENKSHSLKTIIDHEGYITPPINDNRQLLFGATYDLDSLDDSLSDKANQQNLNKLRKHLPDLADSLHNINNGHAAIRRVTPDRLPYLGAVPDLSRYKKAYADLHHGKHWKQYPDAHYHPNLFISAAYGSRGLTTAGLCAEILACMMNNEAIPVSEEMLDALHPGRFCIRQLKRNSSPA